MLAIEKSNRDQALEQTTPRLRASDIQADVGKNRTRRRHSGHMHLRALGQSGLDRRFGLRERLSSVLVMSKEDTETDLGQALAADAQKRAEKLDVRDKFQWGLRRSLMLPLIPALIGAALWYAPNRLAPDEVASKDSKTTIKQIKNSTKPLLDQIKNRLGLKTPNNRLSN